MAEAPREVYVRGRERCVGTVAAGEARSIAIGRARLACFALLVAAGWGAWVDAVPGATMVIPIVGFVALVFVHEREHRRIDRARRGVAHYDDGLARLDGTWVGRGNARTDLVAADHPYARDLDLFGRGSVFELLWHRSHGRGRAHARGVAVGANRSRGPGAAARRRRGARALGGAARLALASLGEALRAEVDPEALARWGEATLGVDAQMRSRIAVGAWVLPPCVAATGALWSTGVVPAWPMLVVLALLFAFPPLGASVHRGVHLGDRATGPRARDRRGAARPARVRGRRCAAVVRAAGRARPRRRGRLASHPRAVPIGRVAAGAAEPAAGDRRVAPVLDRALRPGDRALAAAKRR